MFAVRWSEAGERPVAREGIGGEMTIAATPATSGRAETPLVALCCGGEAATIGGGEDICAGAGGIVADLGFSPVGAADMECSRS